MGQNEPGVYSRSVHGGKWILISNIVQKFLSLLTFFILARLLIPQDYGIMAIVFVVVGFFTNLGAIDFQKALMQQANPDDDAVELAHLDTIWTFTFIKAVLLASVIVALAYPIAKFFNIGSHVNIVRLGSIFVFIPGLSNSRLFYFFKNLDFKKIFIRDVTGQIFYMIVAFSWIFFVSHSVWALFAGHVARYVSTTIMTYVLYPNRQKFSFKFKELKKLYSFTGWTYGLNILDFILGIVDSIYIGHLLDADRLGLYTKARDMSYIPVSPFFIILDKVGFVAYAKLQGQLEKIQEGFIKTFDVVISVTLPIFLLLLVEGGVIVKILLGQKWLGIVMPLKILSACTIFSSLVAISRPIFDGMGRPDINVRSNILQLLSLVVLVYFGAHFWGLNGVAYATLFSWFIILAFVIFQARPILHLGWDKFSGSVITVSVAMLAAIVTCSPLYIFSKFIQSTAFSLVLVALSGVIYIVALWLVGRLFRRSPWHTIVSIFNEVKSKKFV